MLSTVIQQQECLQAEHNVDIWKRSASGKYLHYKVKKGQVIEN